MSNDNNLIPAERVFMRRFWNNRTACSVIDELKTMLKAQGYDKGPAIALIEELQIMFNKMESALSDKRDIQEINNERHKLKLKYADLVTKIRDAGGEIDE